MQRNRAFEIDLQGLARLESQYHDVMATDLRCRNVVVVGVGRHIRHEIRTDRRLLEFPLSVAGHVLP